MRKSTKLIFLYLPLFSILGCGNVESQTTTNLDTTQTVPSIPTEKQEEIKDDSKARLNAFWILVGLRKSQNQLPKTIDDFIYGCISHQYPDLPLSEVMVRIETIKDYPEIQEEVFSRIYNTYAKENEKFENNALETVFDQMCGNKVMADWVVSYVKKKYSNK